AYLPQLRAQFSRGCHHVGEPSPPHPRSTGSQCFPSLVQHQPALLDVANPVRDRFHGPQSARTVPGSTLWSQPGDVRILFLDSANRDSPSASPRSGDERIPFAHPGEEPVLRVPLPERGRAGARLRLYFVFHLRADSSDLLLAGEEAGGGLTLTDWPALLNKNVGGSGNLNILMRGLYTERVKPLIEGLSRHKAQSPLVLDVLEQRHDAIRRILDAD